jgi:hypothetical protein
MSQSSLPSLLIGRSQRVRKMLKEQVREKSCWVLRMLKDL